MSETKSDQFPPEVARPFSRAIGSVFLSLMLATMAPVLASWLGTCLFVPGASDSSILAWMVAPFCIVIFNCFTAWGWVRNVAAFILIYAVIASNHWRAKLFWALLLFGLVLLDVNVLREAIL